MTPADGPALDDSAPVDPDLLARVVAAAEDPRGTAAAPGPLAWEGACLDLLDRIWPRPDDGPPPAPSERYRIVRELGRGGFGVVHLARDVAMGREVALKTPLPGMADSPEVRRRFTREALAVAGLDHPNIVPVYDARTVGPVAYIISAYCPGPTLAAWLKARAEPVPPRLAARLVEGLARGVEHAHGRGILHRDLKPANVMLQPGGDAESGGLTPRLTDFGLAKLADGSPIDRTRTGLVIGSPPYMAPEQADPGRGEVGPATDVYALGATLYEVLVGRPPFAGRSQLETLRQVLAAEPIVPQLFRREVPRDLQTICLHALRKAPGQRYPSAAALGDDLARFLDGRPILARPASAAERAWRWARRHPTAAASVAVVAALLVVFGLTMAWSNARLRTLNDQLRREVERADRHAAEVDRQRLVVADREAATDRHLHAARLNLARQAIEAGQPERAQAILADAGAAAGSRRRDFAWRYLWRLSRRELATRGRHEGLIRQVALFADGATLASCDATGQVQLRDAATGRLRGTLGDPGATAEAMAVAPDGARIATAGVRGAPGGPVPCVVVHDVATGRVLARLDFPGSGRVDRVWFVADGAVVAALVVAPDGAQALRAWAAPAAGEVVASPRPAYLIEGCLAVVAAADGRSFWVNGRDGRVRRHAAATGDPGGALEGDPARVGAMAASPDGRLLALAVPPARVLLCDLAVGGPPRVLADEAVCPDELLFSGDAGSLLLVAGGYQARLLRLADGEARDILPLNPGRRGRLRFAASPDGRWIASVGEVHPGGPQPVTLWDVATGRAARTFAGRRKFEQGVFAPDGRTLHLHNDYDVAAWHPLGPPGGPVERFDDHRDEVWAIAFAPDGRTVATSGDDDRIRFWDPMTGARGAVLAGHDATVGALAWHPGGGRIAAGSLSQGDGLKLWDVRTGRVAETLRGHTDKVRAVAFSPDGGMLASGGTDRTVRLWDGATGRPIAALAGHTDLIRALAFAPDGRSLVSVGDDEALRVWDLRRRRPLVVIPERYKLCTVAFAPDGATLASADQGGGIHLRDVATWAVRRVVRSDDKEIRALAFAPDGATLVSAGMSPTIRFWDPATGQSLLEIRDEAIVQVNHLAFSPDGTILVAADHGGRALVYHAPPE